MSACSPFARIGIASPSPDARGVPSRCRGHGGGGGGSGLARGLTRGLALQARIFYRINSECDVKGFFNFDIKHAQELTVQQRLRQPILATKTEAHVLFSPF